MRGGADDRSKFTRSVWNIIRKKRTRKEKTNVNNKNSTSVNVEVSGCVHLPVSHE